jgi:hypothetical protein
MNNVVPGGDMNNQTMLAYLKFIRANYKDGMSWGDIAGISDNFVRSCGFNNFPVASMEKFMEFLQTSGIFTENYVSLTKIEMVLNKELVDIIIRKLSGGTMLEDVKKQISSKSIMLEG